MSFAFPRDFLDSMRFVQKDIHRWAVEWGFWDEEKVFGFIEGVSFNRKPWNFGEKIALAHSELSEALEKHRQHLGKGLPDAPDEHCPEFGGVAIELADCVIRIMDTAEKMNIDLAAAILAKVEYNRSRPKKHGKAY